MAGTITFDEFLKQSGGDASGIKVVGTSQDLHEPTTPQDAMKPNFFQRLKSDFAQRGQDVINAVDGGTTNPDRNPLSAGLQVAGAVAGGAGDIIKETLSPAISAVADKVGSIPAVQKFATEGAGSKVLDTADSLQSKYDAFAKAHPEAAKNLESTINIAGLLAGEKPINAGVDATISGAKNAGKAIATGAKTLESSITDGTANLGKNFTEKLMTVDPRTKTILNETPVSKIQSYITQGESALKDPRKMTPLETAGQKANSALKLLQEKLDSNGKIISDKLNEIGDTTKVGSIANDAKTSLRQKLYNNLGGIIDQKGKVKDAPNRSLKFSDASDRKLIQDTDSILTRLGDNPTLRQVDDAISNVQDQLYKRKTLTAVPVNTQVEATLKSIINDLNKKSQVIGGKDFSKAKGTYSNIKDIHNALNNALGKEGDKGGALFKKFFSPSDAGTKKLFDAVKKETGIDLAQDAVTAKWVMDTLGDNRSASLLEGGIPTSPSGVVSKLVNFAADKAGSEVMKKATLRKGLKYGKK